MSGRRSQRPRGIRGTPDQLLRATMSDSVEAPDLHEPILRRVHARRPFFSSAEQRAAARLRAAGAFLASSVVVLAGVTAFNPGVWLTAGQSVTAALGGARHISDEGSSLIAGMFTLQERGETGEASEGLTVGVPIMARPFVAAVSGPHEVAPVENDRSSPATKASVEPTTAKAAAVLAKQAWEITQAVLNPSPREMAPPSSTMTDQVASFLSGNDQSAWAAPR